jgi:hypothetical protein
MHACKQVGMHRLLSKRSTHVSEPHHFRCIPHAKASTFGAWRLPLAVAGATML